MVIQLVKFFFFSRKPVYIIIKYIIFAIFSIGVNLSTQYIIDVMINYKWELYISMISGTGTGLVVKYVLDKYFIFFQRTGTVEKNIKQFIFYTLMGVVTTFIFWGSELMFHHYIPIYNAKYYGGFFGLFSGYAIKFFLDRTFVFKSGNS